MIFLRIKKKESFELKTLQYSTKMQQIPLFACETVSLPNRWQNRTVEWSQHTNITTQKQEHVEINKIWCVYLKTNHLNSFILFNKYFFFRDFYEWETILWFSKCSVELLPLSSRKGLASHLCTREKFIITNMVRKRTRLEYLKCFTRKKGKYLRLLLRL